MPTPYIGEIRMFAGNFPPADWMFCEGQQLTIDDHEDLFNVIGTSFGGDGETYFALPDLRGRLPLHAGNGLQYGQSGGTETVTLTIQQIPIHTHAFRGSGDLANSPNVGNSVVARSPQVNAFINADPAVALAPQAVASVGGNLPHSNMQPYLCINFIISLAGIFPSP